MGPFFSSHITNMAASGSGMVWFQKEITMPAMKRGCHLVNDHIMKNLPELKTVKIGLLHLMIKRTSASLALNENWDPDVRVDMETFLNKLVPDSTPFRHSCEGPDDMPAHVKACLFGPSLSIPITDGALNVGTWQGVWLCEHRITQDPGILLLQYKEPNETEQ